ncbi:MAG: hypothetical protein Kow001_18110 [Acidobacteriota bacterium]
MKSCEEYRQLLRDRLAEELDGAAAGDLERHLEQCPACNQEARELQAVLKLLKSCPDEPVPRHFFVYEAGRRSFRERWNRYLGGWRPVAASLAAAMVLFLMLGPGITLRLSIGSANLVLGGEERLASFDPEQFKEEMLGLFQDLLRQELQNQETRLQAESARRLATLSEEHRQAVAPALAELEARLLLRIREGDELTRQRLEVAMNRLGNTFLALHQEDMRLVRQQLNRAVEMDRYQAGRTTALMSQISRLAESRPDRGGSN